MTSASDPVPLLRASIGYLEGRLAQVRPVDFSRPTPCPAWDVAALVDHVTHSASALTGLVVTGRQEPGESAPTDVGSDPIVALVRWCHHLLALVDDGVRTGAGPWAVAAAQRGAIEFTTHGWDLAVAVGDDPVMPLGHGDAVLALVSGLLQGERDARVFGPIVEVASTLPAEARLVGFLGRDPAWMGPPARSLAG